MSEQVAGRELDNQIAGRVFGFHRSFNPPGNIWCWLNSDDHPAHGKFVFNHTEPYSTDPKAFAFLRDWMADHGSSLLFSTGEDVYNNQWECSWISGGKRYCSTAPTMELAGCRAALKAVEGKEAND